MKSKVKYMHTLDGKPAAYEPGKQVHFAHWRRPVVLADSLEQIKREQRASIAWRRRQGFRDDFKDVYDHVRVQT